MRGSVLCQEYLSESESESETGVQTHIFQSHSPTL